MIKKITYDQYKLMPWKNGGGLTREIIRYPEESDSWDFRISIAEVNQSGPFSLFPNFQRHLVLLSGNGMILKSNDFIHTLSTPHALFTFSGDVKIDADLINGPNIDFNIIWNPKKFKCEIKIIQKIENNIQMLKNFIVIFEIKTNNSYFFQDQISQDFSDGPYILINFIPCNDVLP